jgi:glucose-6-phosphate 1-dehydrogenase
MTGDASLFTRADEVETAWGIIDPIIRVWEAQKEPLAIYEPGTWGSKEADELLAQDGQSWSMWDGHAS